MQIDLQGCKHPTFTSDKFKIFLSCHQLISSSLKIQPKSKAQCSSNGLNNQAESDVHEQVWFWEVRSVSLANNTDTVSGIARKSVKPEQSRECEVKCKEVRMSKKHVESARACISEHFGGRNKQIKSVQRDQLAHCMHCIGGQGPCMG